MSSKASTTPGCIIILCGPSCAGKAAVARHVAEASGWEWQSHAAYCEDPDQVPRAHLDKAALDKTLAQVAAQAEQGISVIVDTVALATSFLGAALPTPPLVGALYCSPEKLVQRARESKRSPLTALMHFTEHFRRARRLEPTIGSFPAGQWWKLAEQAYAEHRSLAGETQALSLDQVKALMRERLGLEDSNDDTPVAVATTANVDFVFDTTTRKTESVAAAVAALPTSRTLF